MTIDFHNTLVECDRWFDLEVRTLPWEVIAALDLSSRAPARGAVVAAYRDLRASVIVSGVEIDAYDSVERIFRDAGVPHDPERARQAVDALMHDALGSATLVPGADDLARSLDSQGYPLAVVSSAVHHGFLEAALRRFGIGGRFRRVVTSASSGHYKSNPEIYRSAIAGLANDPTRCVHIGDSLRWDVGSAQGIGMWTVWLDRDGPVQPWDDGPLPVPDLTVTSFVGTTGRVVEFIASVNGNAT